VLEAVAAYTRGSAHAAFAEGRRGVLRAGALADWVLLDVDPGSCSADGFAGARVLRTVVGGDTVFSAHM
jgi:predicted amidohydrolase YtcJ